MNYFEFYGIPVTFRVDEPTLRRIFYQNSKKYHPDFHTLADEHQQAEMLQRSTLNNEAYQTLSDPDRRMRYILTLNGLLEEESKQTMPREFLMEMMDVNEILLDLELDFDQERFREAIQTVDILEQTLDEAVSPILDTWKAETGTSADLQAVLEYFLKKRYLLRIRENLSTFATR